MRCYLFPFHVRRGTKLFCAVFDHSMVDDMLQAFVVLKA